MYGLANKESRQTLSLHRPDVEHKEKSVQWVIIGNIPLIYMKRALDVVNVPLPS